MDKIHLTTCCPTIPRVDTPLRVVMYVGDRSGTARTPPRRRRLVLFGPREWVLFGTSGYAFYPATGAHLDTRFEQRRENGQLFSGVDPAT